MSHDDFEVEPVPGLPALPPEGEQIIWQGSPQWGALARRAYKLHWIAIYFGGLIAYRVSTNAAISAKAAIEAALPSILLALSAIGILAWISRATARASIYTITSHRVVMRIGVALPVTFNLPFKRISAVRLCRSGTRSGDIALALAPGDRIAYLVLWPHVRPWRLKSPEPVLRALADVDTASQKLGDALRAYHQQSSGAGAAAQSTKSENVRAQQTRSVRMPILHAAE